MTIPRTGHESQRRVIDFLSSSATHDGATVQKISTHGAYVFLVGDRAYKLKRAVKFPFMDFSTSEKRRAVLETELALNRPSAPNLYIEVRAIRALPNGRLSFDGTGPVEDWVLVMQRFDQDALLDSMARREMLSNEIIDALADTVVAAHRSAPAIKRDEGTYFQTIATDNIVALKQSAVNQAAIATLERHTRDACAALQNHLNIRARDGFIRHCHGDLHLRNVVVLNGRPVLFDALEFDPALASGDVYYDLAFLLMDLDHRGLRILANRLLNRYAMLTDDLEGLCALPLFLATRAAVRAKVAALSRAGTDRDDDGELRSRDAQNYVDLANDYLPADSPRLIAIGGLSGTGKSTVAQCLAPHIGPTLGALVFRSDVLRKQMQDVPETVRLPAAAYMEGVTASVYQTLFDKAERALIAGQTTIVDAVFATAAQREAIERVATSRRVPFFGLWLEASLDLRKDRIAHRKNDASDATVEVVELQERYDLGEITWRKVPVVGSVADVARKISAMIHPGRAAKPSTPSQSNHGSALPQA